MLKTKELVKAKPKLPKVVESKTHKVFDIPIELLHADEANPNEMDDATFDALCEGMREDGFDDPIEVIPHPNKEGHYLIAGGHHRVMAAKRIGMKVVPSFIMKNWDVIKQKIMLVRRNMLHGKTNSTKFTKLYDELRQSMDAKLLQAAMGFTHTKAFEAVYENVEKNLNPKQKKAFAKAKEKIRSVDDLSSVLNTIFKEKGSELKEGYMVFSFGGKDHHYVTVDEATNKRLKSIKKSMGDDAAGMRDWLQSIIAGAAAPVARVKKRLKLRKPTK